MPIIYKRDIISELKNCGYSTSKLRQDKLFAERTLQKIRNGEIVNADNLALLCKLLKCQPGDLLEYVPDEVPAEKE